MQARLRLAFIAAASVFLLPDVALAGMPSVLLTDWANLRLKTLSFFLLSILVCTLFIRLIWNSLAKDFPKLPKLTYRKTLAAVLVLCLVFMLLLTMIAGARELLTPGAWRKTGLLYKVDSKPAAEINRNDLVVRQRKILDLHAALAAYAAEHNGKFPQSKTVTIGDTSVWNVPDTPEIQYLYVPGLSVSDKPDVLAYEPEVFNDERFVLFTDGKTLLMSSAEIREILRRETHR